MRALGMGSQGADISLWELLSFLTCCLQLTGHWLLIWEANPDGGVAISISSLWNKLRNSCISPLFAWITSHSGPALRESRASLVLCSITASALPRGWWDAAGQQLLRRVVLWRSQRETVALGPFDHPALQWDLQAGRRMLHKHRESYCGLWLIHSGYCYYHQQINLLNVALRETTEGLGWERQTGENKIYRDDFSHLNISAPGRLTSCMSLVWQHRGVCWVVWIAPWS